MSDQDLSQLSWKVPKVALICDASHITPILDVSNWSDGREQLVKRLKESSESTRTSEVERKWRMKQPILTRQAGPT